MKTAAQLRDAAFVFSAHYGKPRHGFVYIYANKADPRLLLRMSREKYGEETTFKLVVGDQEFARDDAGWNDAAAALAALGAKGKTHA